MRYDFYGTLSRPGGRGVCEIDDEPPAGVSQRLYGRVRGRIVLTNTGSCISARGRLQYVTVADCSRCLQPVELPIEVEVNEECALSQIDSPHSSEDEQIPLLDDTTVDLSELVRQLVELHAPPRALCAPDCAGICPQCGVDRNRQPCSCRDQQIDPRLAALRDIRFDQ